MSESPERFEGREHRWSSRPHVPACVSAGRYGDEAGGADSRRSRRLRHPHAGGVARHLGQQVPPEEARRHRGRPRHRRYLPSRRPRDRRCRDHRRAPGALGRALSVGAASRRDSGRTHRLERGSAGSQARDVDHQLHGVGHRARLHGRHPEQGPRGRPHAQGGLRHRIRILHPAPEGRVRQRSRARTRPGRSRSWTSTTGCASRSPRPGGRRGAQMATFDVGHPDVDGVHPGQARGRAPAPVQPLAARSPASSWRRFGTTRSGSSRFR